MGRVIGVQVNFSQILIVSNYIVVFSVNMNFRVHYVYM